MCVCCERRPMDWDNQIYCPPEPAGGRVESGISLLSCSGFPTESAGRVAVTGEAPELDATGIIAAIEQASDAIVVTDKAGTIRYVNPAFTRMTQYTSGEAIGRDTRVLKSGCQPRAFYDAMWATITAGSVWHGELVNRRKDGTLYTEQMTITPVRGPDGAIARYIAIKQD